MQDISVVIIGAGPAGLTAAYELIQNGMRPIVLEKTGFVGGISRTETYKDYYFDIGGHRFFSKFDAINALWEKMLGKDFLNVNRMSRIYYQDRFYNYPLNIANALINLGIAESVRIGVSYIKAQLFPHKPEETFEQWVSNRFGDRLYRIFFKSYTEKVWGIPCHEIRADWAAQRIQGLSLMKALSNALLKNQNAKTLIEEFNYPVFGPGMMWQRFQKYVEDNGGRVRLNCRAVGLKHRNGKIKSVVVDENDQTSEYAADHVISSIPITLLVNILNPKAPVDVLDASTALSHRSFLIVILIIDKKDLFPDQWIYIHSPEVKVGRIQNFKNWSPAMTPDPEKTSVGMEYFCNAGDELWTLSDQELTRIASRELSLLGLSEVDDVCDSYVVRQPGAYPVYDRHYAENLDVIRQHVNGFNNLQTIGRNGMHRYNNMDHSMLTGILSVKNIMGENHDLWRVNDEDEYLEEIQDKKSLAPVPDQIIAETFGRIDKSAFGIATGCISGLAVFLATLWLVFKGGPIVGPRLELLGQYFFGYTVSIEGAFWGFCHGFLWGFLFGGLFAYLRNFAMAIYILWVKRKSEILSFKDFFDHI
jgi:protoporphyrinogen oxidase